MPGFLSKLFRRKNSSGTESAAVEPKQRSQRKVKQQARKEKAKQSTKKETLGKSPLAAPLGPKDEEDGLLRRTPSVTATTTSGRESSVQSRDHSNYSPSATAAAVKKASSSKVLSPRNIISPSAAQNNRPKTPRTPQSSGPVDLDDTDFEGSDQDHDENLDRSNLGDAGLSFHQLQQFNMQQQQNTSHQLYVMSDNRPTAPATKLIDDANHSESSLSEFNLSTDAEDEEYNSMKRKVASYNGGTNASAETSALSRSGLDLSNGSSPMHYTTDDDHIFPALQTDHEGSNNPAAMAAPDDEPGPIKIVSMGADDEMRAWGMSPSTGSSGKENGASPRYAASKKAPDPKPTARRSFTTPAPSNDFANFANFDGGFDANFDNAFPDSAAPAVHTPSNSSQLGSQRPSRRQMVDGGDEPLHNRRPSNGSRRHVSSSASATGDSSLTDLLAQAKLVGRSRRDQGKPSSSSVNSAPAITSQYLRQYHGIGSSARSTSDAKSVNDTSVSDIIQSLEATNAARLRTSSRSRSNRSVGSRDSGANASTRSAKERIRERRRREREGSSSSRNPRSSQVGSDESEENDPSESWLFDEVTGALGPRGVAADMESLSGRSNRSKNSGGGRSHKSHRSHRSHRSSRRRPKSSSNESVDSRGSRNSRNSRGSRYSHKSTRSYLSQMSEQSRSVANDLLRLEMQLAMVGSQENGEEGAAAVGGRTAGGSAGGSVGGSSRASRTSRKSSATTRSSAITKRSKVSVIAPPGKLGIILANKADSKGTVVSGVRTSSVLAEKISPGDRIIAIDGEDVSRMTVSEITTIMARKSEFERTLTVLTTPKHMTRKDSFGVDPDGTYSSSYRR
mmetsp:Transcript_10657/g.17645  ORF Transcript_10657/g.17645 Transcript_10657/m.17645 type:complete len:847 (-) Transcript_10657:165-2705(-)|eukprot:CAMPEP_0119021186 /NCGR_PEP_ID=MMETSP1176-20130426/25475_1 /TAXON_ID=265551 /ORGANISM="Synedropsis recta cf, Strain CCMP1620" /LENGTH=846 /DNA_ID=CAMNT_0006975741 /DNA_START=114 /DNA_END=2657 /DNA_ORIENTATION=+